MKPLLLQGSAAFSPFRLSDLRNSLQQALPAFGNLSIQATEVYLLETSSPSPATRPPSPASCPPPPDPRTLALLNASGEFKPGHGFFVTPRMGTISPWSSKATDIFTHCGIKDIARVERGIHFLIKAGDKILAPADLGDAVHLLYDRMTEGVYDSLDNFFSHPEPAPLRTVPLFADACHAECVGPEAFKKANVDWGLALSPDEIDYLVAAYQKMGRNPTDAELVMFSQVNSEHCRHKIFNADWVVDGEVSEKSLFAMIRNTHKLHPEGTLVAYSDNSGVLEGVPGNWWEVNQHTDDKFYQKTPTTLDILCKVETHNHPTAISPFPGAATGVGGEIRDEGATGIGGRPKAGLSAFMVSNLEVPDYKLPWEIDIATGGGLSPSKPEHPARMASPLDIMLEGPIGGAAFGNEFGRPQLCGMFRTLQLEHNGRHRGYHKPIMAAGGMGNLKREHVAKKDIPPSALIIQLGGPAMKIGLGGGAASSIAAGDQSEDLDFDSVQRGNPEMERRCQQVIDGCIALGDQNPMLSIHDIGAGGLSNGLPELVEATGGHFKLRNVHNEDRSMSPMEIWCNESQERYVLGLMPDRLAAFEALCTRERCPFAVVGEATDDGHLILEDSHFNNQPIDLEMGVLLGKTPKMLIHAERLKEGHAPLDTSEIELEDAVDRILRFPAVANKSFLITIADRSITGLVTRDQMVGPWQTPVADVAVTSSAMDATTGEAMGMGERTPIAILNAPASGRMAIGECLTNMAAADIGPLGKIKLSANWMVAAGEAGEDANLYDTVKAVGMELCPALGICIPVGKDSMSMRSSWKDSQGTDHKQVSPLSLMITGFAGVRDVRNTLTPDLKSVGSSLFLLDLGQGQNRMGGSTLAQVYNQMGDEVPDLDDPELFVKFFTAIQELISNRLLLSYHDRSDGGLLATLAEMGFAGRKGVELEIGELGNSGIEVLFTEELGAVIEVDPDKAPQVLSILKKHGLTDITHNIGTTTKPYNLIIPFANGEIYTSSLTTLNRAWSELSYRMQALRDNPECAKEEYDRILDEKDEGLIIRPKFDSGDRKQETGDREDKSTTQAPTSDLRPLTSSSLRPPSPAPCSPSPASRPRMAIFREQGINGQNEMAFAFDKAGFQSVDVHMTDLLAGRVDLKDFQGLVACGGFSYGDVLGAGSGWAKSILYNERLLEMFQTFFERPDSFTLGVCNGCQMVAQLKDLIPGAEHWPAFKRNRSEQFEARVANVEVLKSPSLFFQGMEGSLLPIPVAHGEGRADFSYTGNLEACKTQNLTALRYINGQAQPATTYPHNPNGSPEGLTAFTTPDGRATIMMPHPERCFRSVQMSYRAPGTFKNEEGPWMRMFENAFNATT